MTDKKPADETIRFAIEETERVADGFRPLERLTLTHGSLTGGKDLRVKREILRAPTAAVVIAYDPVRDALVVVRQFRIGAALATPHPAPLELPAGLVDDGEDARQAAIRELEEETGLVPQAIEEAFVNLSSPGLTDEKAVFFLALVDSGKMHQNAGLASEHEDIVPMAFGVDALIEAVDEGRIANGFLFASLQWFARRGRERAARLGRSKA